MKSTYFFCKNYVKTLIPDFLRLSRQAQTLFHYSLQLMHYALCLPVNLHACILYDLTIVITFRLSNLDPVDPTRIFIYEHL